MSRRAPRTALDSREDLTHQEIPPHTRQDTTVESHTRKPWVSKRRTRNNGAHSLYSTSAPFPFSPHTCNNNTPALLGKRWHPAHPRMYRCRPAAAAPLTLPISNPSDVGCPRSTRDAGLLAHTPRTPEPSAVDRAACAPSPAHTSSATCTYPLPHTEPLARRLPWVRFVAWSQM